ncbi:HdaA/DnaA family protein [Kordiimonas pumila]|uniref:DnaA ATPase domain-containing protein n=1 Tax=Kordiimonas pumila TaxID=2161677 RepID=A0ABV7D1F3_9PROT|nr:DnaA/Hda family protein [Kordiimonas pumila]
MKTTHQIPLDLTHVPSFSREDFIVSGSNSAAITLLDNWQSWPGHTAALVGPTASGKTHIANIWAEETGAIRFNAGTRISELAESCSIVLDDIDDMLSTKTLSEENLFHLFNWSREKNGIMLITARTAPNNWPVKLPDLKSRLATVHIGTIGEPDDNLLLMLLVKLFSDRQLTVKHEVMTYITAHMERSFSAAYDLVNALDHVSLTTKRNITKPLVKSCLNGFANG